MMIGDHLIKHWSKTQSGVALSSGEAELYALVKASVEIINLKSIFQELGVRATMEVATDSSAARGAVHRAGNGRMKHISMNHLWVQERASSGERARRDGHYGDVGDDEGGDGEC